MGLIELIFGKRIKLQHDFWGQMIFVGKANHPRPNDYFECRRHFKPSNTQIEIGIDSDSLGPTQIQIDFFKDLESSYDEITKSMIPLIESEFRNWVNDFKINNFNKEFLPVYLKIPRCQDRPIEWEIAFESSHDENHTITMTMQDFEAKGILIDG
jgi:hypothetical protein